MTKIIGRVHKPVTVAEAFAAGHRMCRVPDGYAIYNTKTVDREGNPFEFRVTITGEGAMSAALRLMEARVLVAGGR